MTSTKQVRRPNFRIVQGNYEKGLIVFCQYMWYLKLHNTRKISCIVGGDNKFTVLCIHPAHYKFSKNFPN